MPCRVQRLGAVQRAQRVPLSKLHRRQIRCRVPAAASPHAGARADDERGPNHRLVQRLPRVQRPARQAHSPQGLSTELRIPLSRYQPLRRSVREYGVGPPPGEQLRRQRVPLRRRRKAPLTAGGGCGGRQVLKEAPKHARRLRRLCRTRARQFRIHRRQVPARGGRRKGGEGGGGADFGGVPHRPASHLLSLFCPVACRAGAIT